MSSYEKLVEQLVTHGIDEGTVRELIAEYRETKKQHRLEDHEKAILHAARFAELTLAFIKNYVEHIEVDMNNIRFNSLLNEILNYRKNTGKDEILTLAIPKAAVSIYTIRNKKRVAHVKTIDPDVIDSSFCVSACDWILSELAMLFYTSDPKEANELINSLLEKKIPLIEEFENGSIVILKKGALKEEFLLALYSGYPKRIASGDLMMIVHYNNSTYAEKVLRGLEGERLIHRNDDGNKLTRNGIKCVEETLLSATSV